MEDSTQLTTTTSQDLALIPEMDDAMTRMAASTIKFTDKVASYTLKFMVFYAVLCVYVLNQLNTLPRCSSGRRCATPMLDLTQDVDVLIHASLSGEVDTTVAPTYVARNASGKSYDAKIPLSADVRKGGAPLTAHVFLLPSRQGDWDWSNDTAALARAFFVGSAPLTVLRRVTSQRMKPRKLLQAEAYVDRDDVGSSASHWRFGRWPLVIRMLDAGELDYERAIREQQHHLGVGIRARHGRYFPVVHVDESLALATHALPISRNTSFPDPILKLQVKTASPLHFGLRKTLASQLLQFAAVAMPEAQVDELRWQISDRRVFRFAAQQLVSLVHVAFDYLAFSEDVGFYVGRETFHGISKASLVWNLVRDLILYLYLQEQEAGLVVLFGLMLALLSDFFKIQRVLKPALVIRPRFPLFFIVTAPLRTPPAKATASSTATTIITPVKLKALTSTSATVISSVAAPAAASPTSMRTGVDDSCSMATCYYTDPLSDSLSSSLIESARVARVRTPTPVAPLGCQACASSHQAVPAMSRCAQGSPPLNRLRNSPAVIAPAGRPPMLATSAVSLSSCRS